MTFRRLHHNPLVLALLVSAVPLSLAAPPIPSDPSLTIELFAESPAIVHPIGLCFHPDGQLLAIESHSHFPPKDYKGPKHDRILRFDAGGKPSVFFEGIRRAMDIAAHPDGSIYLATRNEILRITRDGKSSKRVVFLDTAGDYPHNGLSGLAFDHDGNLFFGMGENLGEPYSLAGTDDHRIVDGGEGGNIFWCTKDGKQLRRHATGFWNPFGNLVDHADRLLSVDNDPDSSPPCRFLHVIKGGDYGYQFRYGRSGLHVFQAWNGELPGTLPMICGTGEAPCELIQYGFEGSQPALPAAYHGDYFVASWGDHRIERYQLQPRGASWTSHRQDFIQGDDTFWPVGLAVAPDGALYISDWARRDYNLHGEGRIWRVRPENSTPIPFKDPPPPPPSPLDKVTVTREELASDDPFIATRAIDALAARPISLPYEGKPDPLRLKRAQFLTYRQRSLLHAIPRALESEDPMLRLLALKWISDKQLKTYKHAVETLLQRDDTDSKLFAAAATALIRLDRAKISDKEISTRALRTFADPKFSMAVRSAALRHLAIARRLPDPAELAAYLDRTEGPLQKDLVRALRFHPNPERAAVLSALQTSDRFQPVAQQEVLLEHGELPIADATGEQLFFHPTPGCFRCHRVDGFGRDIGPDLSRIGANQSREFILESIVEPSKLIAPRYAAWAVTTKGGQTRLGFLRQSNKQSHNYIDITGKDFRVKTEDIQKRDPSPASIMPPGLLDSLTEGQRTRLIDWLASLR